MLAPSAPRRRPNGAAPTPGMKPQPTRCIQGSELGARRRSSRPQWLKHVDPGGKVLTTDAGWSSSVARRAHNPEVAGSNPVPATRKTRYLNEKSLRYRVLFCPDETESLCYSLPFSQTQARRRGGGRGDYHPTSRTIIQRPFGAYDYLRSCMISWEGGCRGGFSPPNRR